MTIGTLAMPSNVRASASAPTRPIRADLDPVLYGTTLLLMGFGVIMVLSSSYVMAHSSRAIQNGYHFGLRQGVFALIALPLMIVVSRIDYQKLRHLTYPALAVTTALMLTVLFLGRRVGGAVRWLHLGPINVQPVEIAKVAMVLWLAHSLSKKAESVKLFRIGILPHLLVLFVFAGLSLLQRDLGSAVMMGLLTFLLLFVAGAKVGPIALTSMAASALVGVAILSTAYRMERIEAFFDPFAHRRTSGYQVVESLLSFGSGGVWGVGLGDSQQKFLYLPDAHTDFIAAIVGEELGFVGIVLLIVAFAVIVVRGTQVALAAPCDFGTYLAFGLTAFFGLQAFGNMGVALGLLPNKGMVLPFISYGGSSLLTNAAAMGVLLSISRRAQVGSETDDASLNATVEPHVGAL